MQHYQRPQRDRGWYPDPDRPGLERFWDGDVWTKRLRQVASTRRKINNRIGLGVAAGCVMSLLGLAAFVATPTASTTAAPSTDRSGATTPATPSRAATPRTSPTSSGTSSPSPTQRPSRTPTRKATPTQAAQPTAKPGTALAAAQTLVVKGRAARTDYDRALFGQRWSDTDRNGCDQRNDVLRRDLKSFKTRAGSNGCSVLTGTLDDPYTGKTIDFRQGSTTSNAVQIDHVVALSDGWQKGAQQWKPAKREKFANDFLNLTAVDGPTKASKGDGDAATWLPPNKAHRCAYVARQVAVKTAYGIWVTEAEQAAMINILSRCPDLALPTEATVPQPDRSTDVKPKPKKTKSSKQKERAKKPIDDPYFKNCAAVREAGKAPIHRGDPGYGSHLDRDGDGIGCEVDGSGWDGREESDESHDDHEESGDGAGEPTYENCTAVREAGKAPIHRGDPGYGSHLDRDGDGVACES